MLVTLEGLDGSGKTTVWEALQGPYPGAVYTREPTESWYGEAVERSLGAEDADPVAELFLYTADHAAHLARTIRPAIERGDLVVSDRYSDSRYAYQGASLQGVIDHPMEYVRGVHKPFTVDPDLTIYLDVDPERAANRSAAANKFERAEFLADVQANYETLIGYEPERFVRIDAAQSPEEVIAAAEDAIARLIED